MKVYYQSNYLAHAGVKGMKWGVRKAKPAPIGRRRRAGTTDDASGNASPEELAARRKKRAKTAALIGGGIVAAGLATYGAYKVSKIMKDKKQQKMIAQWEAEAKRKQREYEMKTAQFKEAVENARKYSTHGSVERFGWKESW